MAVTDLLTRVCRASVSGDGGSLTTQATKLGLGDGNEAPDDLARVHRAARDHEVRTVALVPAEGGDAGRLVLGEPLGGD